MPCVLTDVPTTLSFSMKVTSNWFLNPLDKSLLVFETSPDISMTMWFCLILNIYWSWPGLSHFSKNLSLFLWETVPNQNVYRRVTHWYGLFLGLSDGESWNIHMHMYSCVHIHSQTLPISSQDYRGFPECSSFPGISFLSHQAVLLWKTLRAAELEYPTCPLCCFARWMDDRTRTAATPPFTTRLSMADFGFVTGLGFRHCVFKSLGIVLIHTVVYKKDTYTGSFVTLCF